MQESCLTPITGVKRSTAVVIIGAFTPSWGYPTLQYSYRAFLSIYIDSLPPILKKGSGIFLQKDPCSILTPVSLSCLQSDNDFIVLTLIIQCLVFLETQTSRMNTLIFFMITVHPCVLLLEHYTILSMICHHIIPNAVIKSIRHMSSMYGLAGVWQ